MPLAKFVAPFLPGVGADLHLEDDETIVYYVGTQIVNEEYTTRYGPDDELPAGKRDPLAVYEDETLIGWDVYLWRDLVVPSPRGGVVNISDAPPYAPLGTVLVHVRSTEAMLTTLHYRLFAINAGWGMYPDTDSITPDEEPQ